MMFNNYSMVLLFFLVLLNGITLGQQKKFLFDATKQEQAGNADWVIDADNGVAKRYPTPDQSTVTQSTPETYWTGALSSWGIALVKLGHKVETLPIGTAITFGNSSNSQDLMNYDVYIVDEPNTPFSQSEKDAIVNFVKNGGGLFAISDHAGADRNNDGWDAVRVWNDLFRTNSLCSYPFDMKFDSLTFSETTSNVLISADSILNGSQGNVLQLKWSSGTSITILPSINATSNGLVWKTSSTQGTSNVMAARGFYGKGKVILLGDSSPADDGSGYPGKNLYPGWTEISGHSIFHMNASLWLANKNPVNEVSEKARKTGLMTLSQNYPNPVYRKVSNNNTKVSFFLTENGFTKITVYNSLGLEVKTLISELLYSGEHTINFSTEGLPSGIYFYQLTVGDSRITKQMIVIN